MSATEDWKVEHKERKKKIVLVYMRMRLFSVEEIYSKIF